MNEAPNELTDAERESIAKAQLERTNAFDNGKPPLSKAEMLENAERNRSDPDWVWIPEWGSRVEIRRLTALEHEETITFANAGGQFSTFRQAVKAIETSAINPTFDLDDDRDWAMLSDADPSTLHVLFAAISILSKLREGRVAEFQNMFPRARDLEETEQGAEAEGGATPDRQGEEPDVPAASGGDDA